MRRGLVATAAAATALAASLTTAGAANVTWTTIKPPLRGTEIDGFAARSNSDIWAVGLKPSGGLCQYATFTEHWNGSSWTPIDSFSDPNTNYVFDSVAVVGKADAWAVGTFGCPDRMGNAHSSTLTEHYAGTRWSFVPSPNGGPKGKWFSGLHSVTAISSNNVWAVGLQIDPKGTVTPLIEHWDGKRWSIVPAPKGAFGDLQSVSSTSASDVWAVGGTEVSPVTALALHFDGTTWKNVKLPTPPGTTGGFVSVKAISRKDAWAVGFAGPASGNLKVTADHWNGTSWQVVKMPQVGPADPSTSSGLFTVDAAGGTGVWAVGGWSSNTGANAVVLRWTGTGWATEPTPKTSTIFRLVVLPHNEMYASDFGFIFHGVISP